MQAERRTIKLAWNCSSEAQLILFKDIANREKNNQACLKLFFRGAAYLIQRFCVCRKRERVWVRMPKKRQFKLRLISFGTMRAESFGEANKTGELKRFACWEWFCCER